MHHFHAHAHAHVHVDGTHLPPSPDAMLPISGGQFPLDPTTHDPKLRKSKRDGRVGNYPNMDSTCVPTHKEKVHRGSWLLRAVAETSRGPRGERPQLNSATEVNNKYSLCSDFRVLELYVC